MKKQATLLGFIVLLIAVVIFTAFTQKEKNKQNQKEEQQNRGKSQGKPDKANQGRKDNKRQHEDKMEEKGNQGKKGSNNNKDEYGEKGKKGKNDDMNRSDNNNNNGKDGYSWNPETFKNRNKIKNQEKVTLCHKFNSGNDAQPPVTIRVSSNALKAHMNHGDVMGDCPAINNNRYSDTFLRNRTDYYNSIQNSQEQVLYSRSILDYALARLASSRLQLATLQNNNMPVADIERKQATVVQLEQNVSLLETLIGITANIVANKFQ